jgi:hypothetical protein
MQYTLFISIDQSGIKEFPYSTGVLSSFASESWNAETASYFLQADVGTIGQSTRYWEKRR